MSLSRVTYLVTFLLFGAMAYAQPLRTAEGTEANPNTPGDILFLPVTGKVDILFIQVDYPFTQGGILSNPGNHAGIVVDALERNSYERADISITITPVLRMPNTASFYQSSTLARIRSDAVTVAEQAGYSLSDFDREVIFSIQVWSASVGRGGMNWRTVMLACDCPYITVHEIGHTFGWAHANFWKVNEDNPISTSGTSVEYGDKFDIMGGSAGPTPHTPNPFHHFNPWFKHRVGWIPDENILTVTESGTYTIQGIDEDLQSPPVSRYTALRIPKNAEKDYWVFYRSKEHYPNETPPYGVQYGPVVTWGYHTNMQQSDLLDMNPLTQDEDWKDAALAVNQTFRDDEDDIEIRVVDRNSIEVEVEVTVPSRTVDRLPVIDVVHPAKGRTVLGQFSYEITAFDPDLGSMNGDGIDRIDLSLVGNFRDGGAADTFAQKIEFSPPYSLGIDATVLDDDQYFLIVKARSTEGGENMIWFPHLIDNTQLKPPALVAPTNGEQNVDTDVNLRWRESFGAESYTVQVGTSINPPVITFQKTGVTDTTITVSGLDHDRVYFWRVNATNSAMTSLFSQIWQFTTIVDVPLAPDLSFPQNGATNVDTALALKWRPVTEADSYSLQLSPDPNFTDTIVNVQGLSDTTYQVIELDRNTQYFWRVRAHNAGGISDWSETRTFTTIVHPPPRPSLSSPESGTQNVTLDPTLSWNQITEAESYSLQVATQPDFATTVVDVESITDTLYQVTDLSAETQYFWRVSAENIGGISSWSDVWTFTTIAAPESPNLMSPSDGAIDVPINPTFSWEAVTDADGYALQVSTRSDFVTTDVDVDSITATSYQVAELMGETQYFWRVRARNADVIGDWSAVWSFITENVSSVQEIAGEIPEHFDLKPNYPNPFNPTTTIRFDLPKSDFVTLKIYSIIGEEITTLISDRFQAGKYQVTFNGSNLSSGVYLFRLQSKSFSATGKMTLMK